MAYGFIGAGRITKAIVEGLDGGAEVFLSPRGRQVGQELADRFPNVTVCPTNQAVADAASVVVLAVGASITRDVLADLRFRPDHVVLCAVAGVSLTKLQDWTAPAAHVVRTIPMPQAAHRQSRTALFPDHAAARELFEPLGGVIVAADEPMFDALTTATTTFAAHLDYLTTITGWLTAHGVAPDTAETYVRHLYAQVGQSLATESLTDLAGEHTTPGGLNEQLLTDLRHHGVPDTVRRALDAIHARLGG
ncbi:NAD(P)-binding domain-containing protein [Amycolatopsis rhabdoformis]|uniref:NAD(P)-binding domain-containing protein n=1 Tax=Amycolatopsis rhabdoformis TaxID=1448059 RepID=A0ABZ1IFT2_9PSEU|nr:NAD(P)-binding domain-containing protein [Amycolatopsis rhabdoformis]WSE33013.1 NAD(P)-binding domain-containing protein [Amycolatopsis rhabdoformis]